MLPASGTSAPPSGSVLNRSALKTFLQNRILVLLAILVVYNVAFAFLKTDSFFTVDNYLSILMNMSIESLIVIGMTVLLIAGNLDLSLGANMALAGIMCGLLIKFAHLPIGVALAVSLLSSIAMGAFNGYIIAYVGVNPLITTLATGFVYQGIAVWLAGPGFTDFPETFKVIGQALIFGVQSPIWFMLILAVAFQLLMSNGRFFRRFYFVGASKRSASMSGINAPFTIFVAFILAAILANFAGVLTASRFNSSMTSIGTGVELRAVTAAVIGGVSFTGGTGTVVGAVLGALFLAFVNNGLILIGVEPSWQNVVIGVVLIVSIVIDVTLAKRK